MMTIDERTTNYAVAVAVGMVIGIFLILLFHPKIKQTNGLLETNDTLHIVDVPKDSLDISSNYGINNAYGLYISEPENITLIIDSTGYKMLGYQMPDSLPTGTYNIIIGNKGIKFSKDE